MFQINGLFQNNPELLSLLDRIYEIKSDPLLQPSTSQAIAKLLKADLCNLVSFRSGKTDFPENEFTLTAKIGENLIVVSRLSKEPFHSQEKNLWRTISHHLRRSFDLRELVRSMAADRNMVAGVLDCLPIGIALVNDRSRILMTNLVAREIIEQNDGLTVANDVLIGSQRAETSLLHEKIFLVGRSKNGSENGFWISVSRPSFLRDYSVLLISLTSTLHTEWKGEYRIVVLVIADPERKVTVNADSLRKIFKFTAAEAELGRQLLEGASLSEAANQLHISLHTVNDRLKSLFRKTSARRQSDLIRILLLSPAILTGEDHVSQSASL